jgi:formate hydrogenlyase subunit 3/multisubunit Na+/H+ antiporter MnhD subunit
MRLIRTTRALGLTMLAVALIAAAARLAGRSPEFATAAPAGVDLGLYVDGLSAVLLGFVGFVTCLVATFAQRNLQGQPRTATFGAGLLIATAALGIMVTGASLPVVAVGWTASGMAVAYLIGHSGTPSARRAASFVRRRLLIGDALLWTATVTAIVLLPSVNRADLTSTTMPLVPVTAVTLLLAGAGVVRSALAPAHRWLPETAEAPTPVSAFLHAGIINGAGIVGALMWPLFSAAPVTLVALIGIGVSSVAVGTWTGRLRNDVKGRLACSTTAQMGYMTLQLGLGLPAAAVLHLIGHGCYKSWLFLRAGGAVTRQRLRPTATVRSIRGIWPYAAAILTVALASALALPAVTSSVTALGITAIVPGILAAATAVVAVSGVTSHSGMSRRNGLTASVLAATGAAAYLWLLLAWEHLLETSLPLAPAFSPGAGIVIVLGVVGSGIGIGAGTNIIRTRPAATLTRRLAPTTLAPWTAMPSRSHPRPSAHTRPGRPGLTADQSIAIVEDAARLCSPAWPLRSVVAANPLAGLEVLSFTEADRIARRDLGASAFQSPASYLTLFDNGRITHSMLVAAFSNRGDGSVDHAQLADLVEDVISRTRRAAVSQLPAPTTIGVSPAAMEHSNLWCRGWRRATSSRGRRCRPISIGTSAPSSSPPPAGHPTPHGEPASTEVARRCFNSSRCAPPSTRSCALPHTSSFPRSGIQHLQMVRSRTTSRCGRRPSSTASATLSRTISGRRRSALWACAMRAGPMARLSAGQMRSSCSVSTSGRSAFDAASSMRATTRRSASPASSASPFATKLDPASGSINARSSSVQPSTCEVIQHPDGGRRSERHPRPRPARR